MFVYSMLSFHLVTFDFVLHISERDRNPRNVYNKKHGVMAVKRKTIHNLVMREIFVSRAGELSHAGDRPKYREPPAQVVRVNRYVVNFPTFFLTATLY